MNSIFSDDELQPDAIVRMKRQIMGLPPDGTLEWDDLLCAMCHLERSQSYLMEAVLNNVDEKTAEKIRKNHLDLLWSFYGRNPHLRRERK